MPRSPATPSAPTPRRSARAATASPTSSGINVQRRRLGAESSNVLVSGNSIRNGSAPFTNSLNGNGIWARGQADTNLSITITNNNINTLTTGGPFDIRIDANTVAVGDPDAAVVCADITGNTIAAGGLIDLNEATGNTLNIEQASAAAVSAANSSATVTADAGVSFGVTCATPPAAAPPLLFTDGLTRGQTDPGSVGLARSDAPAAILATTPVDRISVPDRIALPLPTTSVVRHDPPDKVAAASSLSQKQLDEMVAAAIARWTATGLTEDQIAALHRLEFEVADLPNIYLGEARGSSYSSGQECGRKRLVQR